MSTFPDNASHSEGLSSRAMNYAHNNNHNNNYNRNNSNNPPGTTPPSPNRNQYHSKEELPVSQEHLVPYQNSQPSNVSVNAQEEIYYLETASRDNINGLHHDTPEHQNTHQGESLEPSSNPLSNETSSLSSPTETAIPIPRQKPTHTPVPQTRWKAFRLRVMRLATVRRLQLLWGLLALFGFMSWLALMPAFAFRYNTETRTHAHLNMQKERRIEGKMRPRLSMEHPPPSPLGPWGWLFLIRGMFLLHALTPLLLRLPRTSNAHEIETI